MQWGPCQHVHSGMRAAHQLLPMLHLHMQRVVRVAVGKLANIQVCTPICHPPTSPGAHLPSCFPAMYVVPVSVSCGSCVVGQLVLSCSDPCPLCVAGMVGHRRALHAAAVELATGGCRRVWEKGEGRGVNLSFQLPTPYLPPPSMWLAATVKHALSSTAKSWRWLQCSAAQRQTGQRLRQRMLLQTSAPQLCWSCARRRPQQLQVVGRACSSRTRQDSAVVGGTTTPCTGRVVHTRGGAGQLLCAWC